MFPYPAEVRATEAMASTARSYTSAEIRMCDCCDIERAATPIASTGGAASSTGTTSSVSISTVHGQRGWSRSAGGPTTSHRAKTRRQTDA